MHKHCIKSSTPPWDHLSLSLTPLQCHKAQVLKVSAGSQISQLEFITQFFPPRLSPPLTPPPLPPLEPPWQEPSHSFSVDQLRSCLIRVWTTAAMLFQRAPWHTVAAAARPPDVEAAAEPQGASRRQQPRPGRFHQSCQKRKQTEKRGKKHSTSAQMHFRDALGEKECRGEIQKPSQSLWVKGTLWCCWHWHRSETRNV